MRRSLFIAVFVSVTAIIAVSAIADDRDDDARANNPLTIAVTGDWPYSQLLLDNAARLIDSVNADRSVSLVVHLGDLHFGSGPCTSADILPPIPTSNPGWNQKVYFWFQQFKAPLVYTPGDNEWTDCHKTKQKVSGAPLKELASVRSLFFAKPGYTLGGRVKRVGSQAKRFDPAFPSDAQFVENVMWETSRVVFVTLDLPGSNNDGLPWKGAIAPNPPPFLDETARLDEVAQRNGANSRWLEAAFREAADEGAKAVVILTQADMWDHEAAGLPPYPFPGDGLDGYTALVRQLADLAVHFGAPVLLLNGDSHVYGSDRPLADPSSTNGLIHGTRPVPNLTRITVQGSAVAPAEWLRLSIDPRTPDVFSWTNVPFCNVPTSATCE